MHAFPIEHEQRAFMPPEGGIYLPRGSSIDTYCYQLCSFTKSRLTNARKQAEEIPAAPKTMHITMI